MSEQAGRIILTPKRRIANRAHTIKLKLEVIKFSELTSISQASKEFNVDRKCIRDWKRKRCELESLISEGESTKKRLRGAGWVTRFMKRKGLSLRKKTSVCQKVPSTYIPTMVSHILYVRKMRTQQSFSPSDIFAADETAVWLDCSSDYTLTPKGSKEVSIRTTGHDKLRITVMLTARGDGVKLKPFVLLNRVRPLKELEKFSSKLELVYAKSVWMDDTFTKTYLQKVIGKGLFRRKFLVWDSFKCHISDSTKSELRKLNIDTAVIPGGCTKYIQPADVSWNRPFKDSIRQQYNIWLVSGNVTYTKGGNPRAPPLTTVCEWIWEAWSSLSSELIIKSFFACGILNAVDGSEDKKITSFKEGKDCHEGMDLLKREADKSNSFELPNLNEEDILLPSDEELMEVDATEADMEISDDSLLFSDDEN